MPRFCVCVCVCVCGKLALLVQLCNYRCGNKSVKESHPCSSPSPFGGDMVELFLLKNVQRGSMSRTHIMVKKSYAWWWMRFPNKIENVLLKHAVQRVHPCPESGFLTFEVLVSRKSRFSGNECDVTWHLLGSVINAGLSAISSCCTVSDVHVSRIIPPETKYNCYSWHKMHNRLN